MSCGSAAGQSDNFDDGDDAGWTRYDRTGTAIFSFPNGGYRIQATSLSSSVETDKALAVSVRDEEYSDFYVAADLVAWDASVRSAIGLVFRARDVGPGTTKCLVAYWTPAISGGGNRVFSIYYLWGDVPLAPVAATLLTLETNRTYRMVVTGTGDFIEARVYDLNDLTRPVGYVAGHLDPLNLWELPASGRCGVFAYSRNGTSVDVTYDNFVAAATAPTNVPLPGTLHPVPGAPHVLNRVPPSDKNFHPPTAGVTFTAATFGTNTIDPSGIQLWLNDTEVSSALAIGGSPTSRTAAYSGLQSNTLYSARIVVTASDGKSATNEFWFDTFSEAFVTSGGVKLVEAEDYNYGGGQYQNDPPPSGFRRSDSGQVNGNGVGYLDLAGVPDVDYHDRRSGPEPGYQAYRWNDAVGTFAGSLWYQTDGGMTTLTTNDTPLQKFEALDLPDYQVHHTEGTEWLNYTRDFAPGRYRVFLRLSSYSTQDILFDEVTGDRTQPGQTTVPVGRFHAFNTGHISIYRYFPLVDDSGRPVVLEWSGQKTFRLTMDGPPQDLTRNALQLNYLMFVPAPATPQPFRLFDPVRVGDTFSVSFLSESGFTYTLQHKNALSDGQWTDGASVSGDGTRRTLVDPTGQPARVYRVLAR